VITHREREDGFEDLDDLDAVPGMPGSFLREVKQKLTV
jgi:DNA uptake protein ComE-like DNA-binding protein